MSEGVQRVRWNLIFIRVKHSYGSLYVRTIIVFADNSWLVDNSQKLIGNVRDKL